MLFLIGLTNALAVKKQYRWSAFIDTYFLDQFSYAHKYYKKGK